VAGYAGDLHADLHAPALAAVDVAVGGLGDDHELRADLLLIYEVLPAQAVAVLFLHGAGDQHRIAVVDKAKILHDLGAVDGRDNATQLIRGTAAADLRVILKALIGVEFPVVCVANAHGVDVRVKADEGRSRTQVTEHVAHGVYLDLVKGERLHLLGDALDNRFLAGALAGDAHQVTQEPGHILLVVLSSVLDALEVHDLSSLLSCFLCCTPVFRVRSCKHTTVCVQYQLIFSTKNYYFV